MRSSGISILLPATFGGILLSSLVGCGSADTGTVVETVPVRGVLTYKGQPLEFHQVSFYPQDGQRPAVGTSDAEGRFVLGTNETGDGAMQGSHRVAVTYVGPPNDNPEFGMNEFSAPPPPKVTIPAKYRDSQKSGILIEVPNSGLEDARINLE